MTIQTFEHCACSYLKQWLDHDRIYCATINDGSRKAKLATLEDAARFYAVARTLLTQYDTGKNMARYEPILNILDGEDQSRFKVQNDAEAISLICNVESEISEAYGGRNILSFTTKLLWLKTKHPVIISDSYARTALGIKNNNLCTYYKKWRKEFALHQGQIEDVCSKLSKGQIEEICSKLSKDQIEDVCSKLPNGQYTFTQHTKSLAHIRETLSQQWFHERVFDKYLWNKGKNN